eukprot:gene56488-10530_t
MSRIVLLATHHSLGLMAGTPAFFILSDNPDVQLFCFLMLGAPVPGMLAETLFKPFDLSKPTLVFHTYRLLSTANTVFFMYS